MKIKQKRSGKAHVKEHMAIDKQYVEEKKD